MDEVFGYDKFQNEIVWQRTSAHSDPGKYGNNTDRLLFYTSSPIHTWNDQFHDYTESHQKRFSRKDESGRHFADFDLTAAGIRHGATGQSWRGTNPTEKGRHWAFPPPQLDELERQGRIIFTSTGTPRLIRYLDDAKGTPLQGLWNDIFAVNSQAVERVSFPTQKPLALLQRIIGASSNPGDLVLDAFVGSGTTALAAEMMKDAAGKLAPRRWIGIDCGKFAIHITRKRLIEAGAQPFAVENVGFYARGREWKDLWAERPDTKVYRDAMVELYGGTTVDGFAYLHGRKGSRWIHIGPIDAPIAGSQVDAVLTEAAGTELNAIDILSADIPIDWNPGEAESHYGVKVYPKIIPAAAIDGIRERLARKRKKDANLEEAPDVHFFSPPDIEVGLTVAGDTVTVKLLRLTVDLEDCLSTQDPTKRAQIKERITDWRALVDYWAVDWDYRDSEPFQNDWQSFRTRKIPSIAAQATHSYGNARGEKLVAVKVTDVFGNDGLKVARVVIG